MTFVFAVAAVIVREGRVLAMRRSAAKDAGAGLWETVSGRVDVDEDPRDAIAREVREETGLEVRFDPRPIDVYTARRGEAPMVVVVFAADHVAGEVIRSAEHDAQAWWTPREFRERSTLTRLADAIDRVFTTRGASPGAPDDEPPPAPGGA